MGLRVRAGYLEAIKAAIAAGASNDTLAPRGSFTAAPRYVTICYDFVMSENSIGFHSPREAARILANAVDFARQAQVAAERVTKK